MSVEHNHGGVSCGTHRTYKMDCGEFATLFARAAGHCEACGIPVEESGLKQLVIDHDHRYGVEAVRGLICSSCNTTLGTLEHTQPVAGRFYIPQFGEYLSKAWFVQKARLVRLQQSDPDGAKYDKATRAVLLFVRRLTTATGQQPEVSVCRVDAPGPLQLRATVRHVTADAAAIECVTRLVMRETGFQGIELQSIYVSHWQRGTSFEGLVPAAQYVKEARAFHAAERAKNVAAREAAAARWEAEREARKTAPSPNVERVVLDRFKGGIRFSSRDVMEASGCGLQTAHRTVKAMVTSGAIRADGVGPKASSMGRAPAVYVIV